MKLIRMPGLFAIAALAGFAWTATAQNIVVGGKNFTEQQIMSQMTAQLLQAKGYKVDVKAGMGSAVLRQAQESGWSWQWTSRQWTSRRRPPCTSPSARARPRRAAPASAGDAACWKCPSAWQSRNTPAARMLRRRRAPRAPHSIW